VPGVSTQSKQLVPQAVIRDRDTFFDEVGPLANGAEKARNLFRGS
jgi:hypothetical protein